jgi:phosphate/sulfate permease
MAAAAAVLPERGLAQRRDATDAVTLDAAARAYRVQPGGSIQAALEAAAKDPANKIVYVHAGTYRPAAHGQALIWFNRRHDGITLEAVGEVVLTAANPAIADNKAPSFPAVVNHVVYFGDGVSTKTVLRGFRVTGANNYTLGLGTMVGWRRIVITVGERIGKQHLTYAQGASAELVAMATIAAADAYGLPVSTTQVLSSGVAGTMAANGSGLQWSTVRNLLLAWVLTLPAAIMLSGLLYVLLRHVF